MSEKPTIAQQWRAYGERPPIARWTARASLCVGAAIGVGLTIGALGLLVLGVRWVF